LADLVANLKADPRIEAAWLFGSLGRGNFDGWSDIDIWAVVRDDAHEEVVAERYEAAALLGEVVLTEEAPQNGPPGGSYFMSGHDRPTGIHLIDWYWQPISHARRPGIELLFERAPIPSGARSEAPPVNAWRPTTQEEIANHGAFAWAMVAIQGKDVARGTQDPFEEFVRYNATVLHGVARARGIETPAFDPVALPRERGQGVRAKEGAPTAVDYLDVLDLMADTLEPIAPDWPKTPVSVRKFLETVRQTLARWSDMSRI
jgi:hypothetical protein